MTLTDRERRPSGRDGGGDAAAGTLGGERETVASKTARPWWRAIVVTFAAASTLLIVAASWPGAPTEARSPGWWLLTAALHVPYLLIVCFLTGGLCERIGFFWRGRAPSAIGPLPATRPTVCIQLPMFNEHAVAQRVIEAACAVSWPRDRLQVQVLDDSTDPETRVLVVETCARMRAATGVDCRVLHRDDRSGYKAGALEAGRLTTDAELIAIFDADFVPPPDFLERAVAHFYQPDGSADHGLALVQAQWGHLNADESALTRAQSLWVDDHHTLQMSWRAAVWQFVNFTGTAGVWRASAIDAAGGWRSASLVEDCELSFRSLFAGYRTTFVKELVAPAELPATYTAYKAQQRRWTRGWVQLQRLHLQHLLTQFDCSAARRLHLVYHMCISWQWPLWAIWTMAFPFAMVTGHWLGGSGWAPALLIYLAPTALWSIVATMITSLETKHTYPGRLSVSSFARRCGRLWPYSVINCGMLPHQASAFAEGLYGELHGEFERTPKAATVIVPLANTRATGSAEAAASSTVAPATVATVRRHDPVRIHWPYVLAEACFVAVQMAWAAIFASRGMTFAAVGALYLAACVLYVGWFYGDHAGRRCFWLTVGRPADQITDAPDHRTPSARNGQYTPRSTAMTWTPPDARQRHVDWLAPIADRSTSASAPAGQSGRSRA